MTYRQHVFHGLWCPCPERHYQNASYYVSVMDGGRTVLALGPFREHDEALANVQRVNDEVVARWNPEGRANFYAFGTTAMINYHQPGKLNAVLGEGK